MPARSRHEAASGAAPTARRSTRPACPGIGAALDPIQYNSHTWHTNLDTYERIVEEDVKNSAMVVAAGVYHLAMRDGLLPRFSKEQMPPRPGTPSPRSPRARASSVGAVASIA